MVVTTVAAKKKLWPKLQLEPVEMLLEADTPRLLAITTSVIRSSSADSVDVEGLGSEYRHRNSENSELVIRRTIITVNAAKTGTGSLQHLSYKKKKQSR